PVSSIRRANASSPSIARTSPTPACGSARGRTTRRPRRVSASTRGRISRSRFVAEPRTGRPSFRCDSTGDWSHRCRRRACDRRRSSRSGMIRRTSRSTSTSTTSGCRGYSPRDRMTDLNSTKRLRSLAAEASVPGVVDTQTQPIARGGFLALLLEAGYDFRLDLSQTRPRVIDWVVVMVVSVGSLILWLAAMMWADLGRLTDLGMVSVLPLWSYLSFIPIVSAFVLVLTGPRPSTWLLAAIVVVLLLMLYGAVPFIEGEPRFSPSWRHIGVIDYVTRHGGVDPTLDAYDNWPGMFILASAVGGAIGLTDWTGLALWAPVWFNLLFLPPLYVLLSALTDDRRAVWLALWLFYLMDWIGHDYFSPQACGLFFFPSSRPCWR